MTQSEIKQEIISIASDLREGYMTTDRAIEELKELITKAG